jgi:uncharacterized protein YuzE
MIFLTVEVLDPASRLPSAQGLDAVEHTDQLVIGDAAKPDSVAQLLWIDQRLSSHPSREALERVPNARGTRARTWDRVNVWGTTEAGRMLRNHDVPERSLVRRDRGGTVGGPTMKLTYDDEADAIYVYAREGEPVTRSEILEDGRVVDLDAEGRLIGIEILDASASGVRLADLAERFGLAERRPGLEALERLFRSTEPD